MGDQSQTKQDASNTAEIASVDDYSPKLEALSGFDETPVNASIENMISMHESWAKSFDIETAPVKGKRAVFCNRDLMGYKFAAKDLRAADFKYANLEGADFSGADLTLADFSGANLTNANFCNATLVKATFRDAITDGTDFTGAKENY